MRFRWTTEHERRERGIRGWIKFGPEERYPSPEVSFEAYVGRPVYLVGATADVTSDPERPFSCSLYLWPFSLYVGIESKAATGIAQKLVGERWDSERTIQFTASYGDGELGTVRWVLWMPDSHSSSRDPRWRRGWFDLRTFLFGKQLYRNETLSTHEVVIPMPERAYPATIKLERATWTRARFPFMKQTIRRADVDIPGGIPHEGKGENAWDCGEDATFAITMPADSLQEAIGKTVSSVMRDRLKYGGSVWHRESERAA